MRRGLKDNLFEQECDTACQTRRATFTPLGAVVECRRAVMSGAALPVPPDEASLSPLLNRNDRAHIPIALVR